MIKLITKLKANAAVIMASLIGFLYVALNLSRKKNAKVEAKLQSAKRSAVAKDESKKATDDIRSAVDNQIDENIQAEIERDEIPTSVRRGGRFGTSKRLF